MKKIINIFLIVMIIIFCGSIFSKVTLAEDDLLSGMQEVEKQSFNSKFLQYEGENIRAANVKTLIQAITTNNSSNEKQVKINVSASDIDTTKTYKVKFNYDEEGYVNEAIVTQNNESTDTEQSNNVSVNQTTAESVTTSNEITNNSFNINTTNTTTMQEQNQVSQQYKSIPKTGILYTSAIILLIVIILVISLLFKLNKYRYIK